MLMIFNNSPKGSLRSKISRPVPWQCPTNDTRRQAGLPGRLWIGKYIKNTYYLHSKIPVTARPAEVCRFIQKPQHILFLPFVPDQRVSPHDRKEMQKKRNNETITPETLQKKNCFQLINMPDCSYKEKIKSGTPRLQDSIFDKLRCSKRILRLNTAVKGCNKCCLAKKEIWLCHRQKTSN